jgi:OmpA-OmpF porin, OOP family
MFNRLCFIAVIAGVPLAQARAADDPAGYLVGGQGGTPVVSGYGACVRTSQWTPDMSYRQCDPQPVALQGPAPVPAAPAQAAPEQPAPAETAPRPVLARISMDTLFDFDSSVLRTGPALETLAKELAQADYQTVRIVGRADRIGRAQYNQQLSEQRARAVRDYLAVHGIDSSKIAVSGAGSAESMAGERCKGLQRKELISCLQPDRSAEVTVVGTQSSAMR